MKFTVVTVAYNEEKCIAKTVKSVIRQDYDNLEYLIIDGNSSDRTVTIAKNLSNESDRDVKIYSENDFGIYNAMNRGIVRASGDYIMFMNAGDSFCNSTVLSNIVKQINRDSNALYYGKSCLLKNGRIKGTNDLLRYYRSEYKALIRGIMPVHQSIAAPLYLLKRYYFNEEYKIRADYDWLLKCYKDGIRFVNLGFFVCKYDCSGISERAKSKKLLEEETKIIRRKNFPMVAKIYEILDKWN